MIISIFELNVVWKTQHNVSFVGFRMNVPLKSLSLKLQTYVGRKQQRNRHFLIPK